MFFIIFNRVRKVPEGPRDANRSRGRFRPRCGRSWSNKKRTKHIEMETLFSVVIFSTILFVVIKMIEMKFIQKEMKPAKEIVRDAVIVGVSVAVASFAVVTMDKPMAGFMNAITEKQVLSAQAPVFTDNPGF